MSKKPDIIATGLSGLVGSRIAELLCEKYCLQNLDLTTGVDLTKESSVKKAMEKASGEVVLHLAAYTNVDEAQRQFGNKNGACYKVNVLGSRYAAQYAAKSGKYLIHISTDFVFNGKKKKAYTEKDRPNPIEWYGQTKYQAEKEVKKTAKHYAIVRIAFPFRSHYSAKSDLVRTVLEKLKAGSLYPMFADQIITPTFIDDIAKALNVFIRKRPQGIFHVVGSTSISPFDLAKKIAYTFNLDQDLVKKGSLREYLPTAKRPYQKRLAISNQKIKRELGIGMRTIDQALLEIKRQIKNS